MKLRWSITALLVASCLVFAANFQELSHSFRSNGKPLAYANLRQLQIALAAYHEQFGEYPYHRRGADHALFLLKDFLDVSCLASHVIHETRSAPKWDYEYQRAWNSGWEYLNEENKRAYHPSRILFVSRPIPHSREVYIGFKYGEIHIKYYAKHPGRNILGKRMTADGFIAGSDDVFAEWSHTDPTFQRGASISAAGKLISIGYPEIGITYEYDYRGEILNRRRITIDGHAIEEDVTADEYAQITGIERHPRNWEELWNRKLRSVEDRERSGVR